MPGFRQRRYDLGGGVAAQPLATENALALGPALAAITPWSVIGYPAEQLSAWLREADPALKKFEVVAGKKLAGVIVIQAPFLHGPYLKLIGVLPEFQRRGIGESLLRWMENEARKAEARQLWLCVSTFNTRAQVFYERMGFEAVGVLDKLVSGATDELFMRKRLFDDACAR